MARGARSSSRRARSAVIGAGLRPPMSVGEFRLLADLIHDVCGIAFRPDTRSMLRRRLWVRLEALGLSSFTAYHRYLLHDTDRQAELEQAIDRVTTHETYFFRQPDQLAALTDEILPALADQRSGGRRLQVWSAGCATGEEAYTIAMLVVESGLFHGWDVRVFGSDISQRVLQVARRGSYGGASFRATDEHRLRRFFRELDGKQAVRDEIKTMVRFGQVNLLDEGVLATVSEPDIIICRNVLMYFDLEARRRVVASFAGKLARGGYLLVGHSESLLNLSTAFELVQLKRDRVYRQP